MINENEFTEIMDTMNDKVRKELRTAILNFFDTIELPSLTSYIDPITYQERFKNWFEGQTYISLKAWRNNVQEHLWAFVWRSEMRKILDLKRQMKHQEILRACGDDGRCD